MSDFQQTITSLDLLHTSLYRMELFMNAQAVKNAKTDVISLISRLEKAERERDELRAERDGAMESALAVADAWVRRAKDAEAELARRDAAAGEPVVIMSVSKNSSDDFQFEIQKRLPDGVYELYTAAQPAVLPPEMTAKQASRSYGGEVRGFHAGYNQCRADALALGAQQQKVVELPTQSEYEDPLSAYEALEHVKAALDAANVKYEVNP